MLVKYFIIPILFQISGSDEETSYSCHIVDEKYNDLFNQTLNKKDTEIFVSIMEDNKNALIYRKHEILGPIAYWKIDKQHKQNILNGLRYP